MVEHKGEHKGKKKENLGWEIIKLQAKVGESTSRKAKKAVEAARKKKEDSNGTGEEEASDELAAQLVKLKEIKISQKIYHAKKEIRKAFVKAKSFETQRLGKRLRQAKKSVEAKAGEDKEATEVIEGETAPKKKPEFSEEDITKFENEIELVKKMDMDALSEHAFATKLAKHPILGSHTLISPYVIVKEKSSTKESSEKSGQEALIQIIEARLTNTKTVKDHMAKLWDELEHIVTGKKVDHQELARKRKAGDEEGQDGKNGKKIKMTKDTKAAKDESSDEESGDESEDEDAVMSDGSFAENDDGYDSDGLPLPMNGQRSASSAASMFIGSLNAGSKKDKKDKKAKSKDKNDWVDDKFDEIYGKVKKNRPGQRARRMKAERKFGKDANHVKKAEEEAKLREERKAARKAKQEKFKAKDASTANAQRLPNRRTIGAGDGSASIQRPAPPRAPSGPDPNDPTLHPSWLAKKSEKAAVAAALSGAKSSKIVFDDSD